MKIPLARPYYDEEEVDEVKKVLESRWVAQGPTTEKFEKKVADYVGIKYAIAVNSCTSALHISLLTLGMGKKDEVIIPDLSFPATGNAVLFTGAKPVLVDISMNSYNINPELIEGKITERTKAIMPVDEFGYPCEMKQIRKIANEHRIPIVEDAACAIGSEYCNEKVGNMADLACYSFHARKSISTGEGGMIVTNNSEYVEKLKSFRSHGMSMEAWELESKKFTLPSFNKLGYNYRMSDITAGVGLSQMRKIDDMISKRRKLAKHYQKLLGEEDLDIIIPYDNENTKSNFQSFVITLNKQGIRNKVITGLRKNGIGCTIGTYSFSQLPLFSGKCPNGKYFFENSIALPMFYELKEKEVEYVVNSFCQILK